MLSLVVTEKEEKTIKAMKSMMKSCYAYGHLQQDSYQFNQYLKPYQEKLDKSLFWAVFNDYSRHLKETYEVIEGVYVDSEGCSYNKLKEIKK